MIPTRTIRDALVTVLRASGRYEKVIAHTDADLGAALEHLRDSPSSLAVVVPGPDKYEHEYEPGTNTPVRSESINTFELLIAARELDMRQTGAADSLDFKDATIADLLWDDLSVADLICMPVLCEPMVIQFDDKSGKGREAWKITLEMRHFVLG